MKELKINIPEGYEIDKENSLNFAVEVQDEGEHFLVSAKPSMVMNWGDAMRYFNDNPTWKLPTRKQLKIIHKHLEKINNLIKGNGGYTIAGCFWSCEQNNGFCAWHVGMYYGYTYNSLKLNYSYVRAVSAL